MTEEQAEKNVGEERDKSKPILTTTTIAELGQHLPLGVTGTDGKIHRNISTRPWRLKEERVLGHRRDEDENRNMGKYVSIVLATMCSKLVGQDWSKMLEKETVERELVISQMWMPDVFYAYVWLRIQAMGNHLSMELKCPQCALSFDWTGDLNSLEVKLPKTLDDALYEYELKSPIKIRGKEIKKFVLGPQRWHTVEAMGDTSMGAAKSVVIQSSIHQAPDLHEGDVTIDEVELDELTKIDLETIAELINTNGFGPDLKVEAKCPKSHKFDAPLDWRYDNFFGVSSPSPA